MSWNPTDDDQKGGGGGPQDDEELGHAPTMLYMKPVSVDEKAAEAAEKAADDLSGETLMMMPAVSGTSAADALSDEGTPSKGPGEPARGPIAGPLPEGEGLEELDSAKTMMYMPAVGGASAPNDVGLEASGPTGDSGFSDEVQKKLAALKDTIGERGDDAGSSTMAYMPAVGALPVDQAVDKMLAQTGEVPARPSVEPEKPRVPTAPAFPAVTDTNQALGEAPTDVPEPAGGAPEARPVTAPGMAIAPEPAYKPGPDLDDDDEDLTEFTGQRSVRKLFLILFVLVLLGVGGVFVAMLFDWMARPEFLESLPHYELNL